MPPTETFQPEILTHFCLPEFIPYVSKFCGFSLNKSQISIHAPKTSAWDFVSLLVYRNHLITYPSDSSLTPLNCQSDLSKILIWMFHFLAWKLPVTHDFMHEDSLEVTIPYHFYSHCQPCSSSRTNTLSWQSISQRYSSLHFSEVSSESFSWSLSGNIL